MRDELVKKLLDIATVTAHSYRKAQTQERIQEDTMFFFGILVGVDLTILIELFVNGMNSPSDWEVLWAVFISLGMSLTGVFVLQVGEREEG